MEMKEVIRKVNGSCSPSVRDMVSRCPPNQSECNSRDDGVSETVARGMSELELCEVLELPQNGCCCPKQRGCSSGGSCSDFGASTPALVDGDARSCRCALNATEPCAAATEIPSFAERTKAHGSTAVRAERCRMIAPLPPLRLTGDREQQQAMQSRPAADAAAAAHGVSLLPATLNGCLHQACGREVTLPVDEPESITSTPIDSAAEDCAAAAAASDAAATAFGGSCPPSGSSAKQKQPKKKVVFADAAGLQLASVRLMTEGRDTPPQLDPRLLCALHRQIAVDDEEDEESPQFSPQFAQPLASYTTFADRLARHCVCLESVAVITGQVTGTVKVRNIAFEKEVFVRFTLDDWATFHDVLAYYVNPTSDGHSSSGYSSSFCGGGGSVYDTFAFSVSLPVQLPERGLQFAVCFRCRAGTFWDNNDSRNYSILWEDPARPAAAAASAESAAARKPH